MKNRLFIRIAIVLVAVMLLGQIFGGFAIRYFFLTAKLNELSPQLLEIAEEIAENGNVTVRGNEFILKAYDLFGKEIPIDKRGNRSKIIASDTELWIGLSPYMPKVLAGQNLSQITDIKGLLSTTIMMGVPIIKGGKIIGTVFLLKAASDFRTALSGFYAVFFCTSLLSSAIILTIFAMYLKTSARLEQMRRDYIANISHELRTPISSIKALSETLCDSMLPNEIDKIRYYHMIQSESVRLERLISDMLELSRLQSGKLAFEKCFFSGAEMMDEISAKFAVLADDMDIQFSVSDSSKNLSLLFSNKDRIVQVLHILIDNAFKFCGDDGEVLIDAELTGKKTTISVSNTGELIDKADLPFVFDRFYQSEKSHNNHGSGLGLAIAKEILGNLGETMTATSEKEKYTTFSFTVKLQ